ncbi:hypothetical protein quinque_000946 [Culex quinquefasciatus]
MTDAELNDSAHASKILSLCWSSGTLAASYYDIDQLELYAILQATEPRPQYPLARNLIRQYTPLFYLLSGSKHFHDDIPELLDLPEGTVLQRLGTGKIETHEHARTCEFSSRAIKNSMTKILSMNLPGMPTQASESERRIFLASVLPVEQELLIHAVGSLLKLLEQIIPADDGPLVTRINVLTPDTQLIIDELTYQSLQIFNSRLHPSGFKQKVESSSCSLIKLFNRCSSNIGKLELRTIMQQPVRDLAELELRLNTVQWSVAGRNSRSAEEMRNVIGNLTKVQPVYRKIAKQSTKNSDWKSLKKNVYYLYMLCKLCLAVGEPELRGTVINILAEFVSEEENALKQLLFTLDEVVDLDRGNQNNKFTVKRGIDRELDRLRTSFDETRGLLMETSRVDFENLPVDMSDVYVTFLPSYGYVFSSSRCEELRDPAVFEQSAMNLVFQSEGSVYFQNDMCKELNTEFGNLLVTMNDRENTVLMKLVSFVDQAIPHVLAVFKHVGKLDVLLAFASVAVSQEFTRPSLTDQKILQIKQGRHPLVEQFKTYQPNDTDFSAANERIVNVFASRESTGKTLYLKEIALIAYLAHIGSFVPAQSATIGLLDSIYSRLDFPESIFSGKSSFMGELYQMSNILMNTTSKSLVLIDEFGKGTTYTEGKALLISSVEHLLQKGSQAPIVTVATQFTDIKRFLGDNRYLRIYATQPESSSEDDTKSSRNLEASRSRQDTFTNAIQTMTLALVKKYVAGESIDPVTLVMLYKSTPITQAGISR